jgi:hypothetical protein
MPCHACKPALAKRLFHEPGSVDACRAACGQMHRQREPLIPIWFIEWSQPATVLVITPGKLHVVEYHHAVNSIQLGERTQPREEVRLMNSAAHAI